MTTGVTAEKWPEQLAMQADALDVAVAQGIDFERWPEGERVIEARQPRAIAEALIPALHPHLKGARIAYLWFKEKEKNGRTVLGHASVASAKVRFFGEVDFLIEFNHKTWKDAKPEQLAALVDHELSHCGVVQKDGEEHPTMIAHDVEEFGPIVSRWGLWKSDLQLFGAHMRKALQLDLFGGADSGIDSITLETPGREPVTISRAQRSRNNARS